MTVAIYDLRNNMTPAINRDVNNHSQCEPDVGGTLEKNLIH